MREQSPARRIWFVSGTPSSPNAAWQLYSAQRPVDRPPNVGLPQPTDVEWQWTAKHLPMRRESASRGSSTTHRNRPRSTRRCGSTHASGGSDAIRDISWWARWQLRTRRRAAPVLDFTNFSARELPQVLPQKVRIWGYPQRTIFTSGTSHRERCDGHRQVGCALRQRGQRVGGCAWH